MHGHVPVMVLGESQHGRDREQRIVEMYVHDQVRDDDFRKMRSPSKSMNVQRVFDVSLDGLVAVR